MSRSSWASSERIRRSRSRGESDRFAVEDFAEDRRAVARGAREDPDDAFRFDATVFRDASVDREGFLPRETGFFEDRMGQYHLQAILILPGGRHVLIHAHVASSECGLEVRGPEQLSALGYRHLVRVGRTLPCVSGHQNLGRRRKGWPGTALMDETSGPGMVPGRLLRMVPANPGPSSDTFTRERASCLPGS